MSNELEFINFTISFHRRLGQIIEKWSTAKELVDMLPEEEQAILRVLHRAHDDGEIAFGNENRDAGEVIRG